MCNLNLFSMAKVNFIWNKCQIWLTLFGTNAKFDMIHNCTWKYCSQPAHQSGDQGLCWAICGYPRLQTFFKQTGKFVCWTFISHVNSISVMLSRLPERKRQSPREEDTHVHNKDPSMNLLQMRQKATDGRAILWMFSRRVHHPTTHAIAMTHQSAQRYWLICFLMHMSKGKFSHT